MISAVHAPDLEPRVRAYLASHRRGVAPYTAERIAASFEQIPLELASCEGLRSDHAYDVGSGAGFDTFALAERFDRVGAIDSQEGQLAQARQIATATGIKHIEFVTGDVLRVQPPAADLVWCNVMSHNTAGRIQLLRALARATRPGGWLVYAEECEGYVGMELCRAVARRDPGAVRARLRQGLAGVLGRPGGRFFVAGTIAPLLSYLGFAVCRRHVERWGGLAMLERVWAKREHANSRMPPGDDSDYLSPPAELVRLRRELAQSVDGRRASRVRATAAAPSAMVCAATAARTEDRTPMSAFELLEPMASAALPRGRLQPTKLESAIRQLSFGPIGPRIDWSALDELTEGFRCLSRAPPEDGVDGSEQDWSDRA